MKRFLLLIIFSTLMVFQPVLGAERPVKDFTLPSATDGSLISLSDYSGKVVLINWWRTDCAWSQKENPKLVSLYQKYRSKGLVILGVSDDTSSTVAQVPSYIKQRNNSWPIGLNDQGEFMREIVKPFGGGETPGNYVVSRDGRISYLGLDRNDSSWQKLEETVVRLLDAPGAQSPAIKPRAVEGAPSFSLPDLQGKTVKLPDFAGKPLLINFFTADTCDWAGAALAKVHREYAGKGLQVVGINLFDQDPAIQSCINKHAVNYPILRGNQATQRAWIGSNEGWATFFVTSEGKISKKILDSIENGIEGTVFTKYAEYILQKR
jgi:peroxiredoxin